MALAITASEILDVESSAKYRNRWWTLLVVSVALCVLAMDTTIVNVAVPEIQRELGASASSMQWIIDSYLLVFAGLLLTMGSLGDRFGRRLLLQVGMASFAAASLFAAYADSSSQLIIARALTGIGAATVTPATLSIIVDTFPSHERAKAIAIWSAAAGIGVPLGQIVGGALLEQFWWGSIFFVNLPVCLFVLLGTFTVVSESRDPAARPIDVPGALLSTATLGLFVFGIIEAPSRGWADPLVLGSLVLSVVLAVAFVAYELRARFPMLDVRLMRHPGLSMGSVALVSLFLAMLGMMFLLTQYLQLGRGYSALQTGLLMCPLPLGFAVGSGISEKAASSFGVNRVTSFGLAATAAAMGALSLIGTGTEVWIIEVILVVFGLGGGAVMAPATAMMMGSVPEENAGVGGALNEATRVIGIALGVSVLGSIANSVFSSQMHDATADLGLQGTAHEDSIGAATQIAAQIGGPAGAALQSAAEAAFVDAFSAALIVGGAIALAGALAVLKFMPSQLAEEERDGVDRTESGINEETSSQQGGTKMIKGLGGTSIWTSDLNNLLPFYRDTLGMKVTVGTPEFALLGPQDEPALGIGTHSEVKGKSSDPYRHMVGLNSSDLDADYARLKDAGVEFIEKPTNYDGLRIATLKDPEGNLVQLFQPAA